MILHSLMSFPEEAAISTDLAWKQHIPAVLIIYQIT